MGELFTPLLAVFALIGFIIGFSKTSVGGLAAIAVAVAALAMPAKESTAAILAVLIAGDVVAVSLFGRHVDWSLLRRLIPAVLPGLILGTMFLAVVSDEVLRRSIGVMLLVLGGMQLWLGQRRRTRPRMAGAPSRADHPVMSWVTGGAAGFTTMTANAAGAVMTLYFVAKGVEKSRFIGSIAWFFLGVNLAKVPFSVGLGLMAWDDIGRAVLVFPLVVLGGFAGRALVRRLDQHQFDIAVLLGSALAAVVLIVS
ncbi:MAG: sulfite exporter TauE/SafE family protein [Dermatophilaceae bacterium]